MEQIRSLQEEYHLFSYYGAEDGKNHSGNGSGITIETIEYLNKQGKRLEY